MAKVSIELVEDRHALLLNWLCRNLSARDAAEVYAVQFTDDPRALADRILATKGFTWIVLRDGKPVAVVGCACMWPGMWQAFAFGTDEYSKVIVALSRHVRKFIIPALTNHGVRLVQCFVAADYVQARNWLSAMLPGCKEEVVIEDFGKGGEAFVMISWRPQKDRRLLIQQAAE